MFSSLQLLLDTPKARKPKTFIYFRGGTIRKSMQKYLIYKNISQISQDETCCYDVPNKYRRSFRSWIRIEKLKHYILDLMTYT